MKIRLLPAVVIAAMGYVGAATAAPITINNFSFEDPYVGANIPGWTKENVASSVITVSTFTAVSGPTSFTQGTHGVIVYGGGQGIKQTLTDSLAASTTYTLQIDIAGTTSYQGFQLALVGGSQFTFLVEGSRSSNTITAQLAPGSNVGTFSSNLSQPITLGQWSTLTMTVSTTSTLTSPGNLELFVRTANGSTTSGNSNWTAYDNVRLTAVPEPSVIGSLALAGACVAFVRFRKMLKA